MNDTELTAFKRIKSQLAEHFDNFSFVVLDEEGDLNYSYKNQIIGKALFQEAVKIMRETEEFENEYCWEDDDEWEEKDD